MNAADASRPPYDPHGPGEIVLLRRIRRLAAAWLADPAEDGNAARILDELRLALVAYHEQYEKVRA